MAAWPGGPCPECGDAMPPRVLRCRTCGALLNPEVQVRPLLPPEPVVLPEVPSVLSVTPRGSYVGCPNCERELRIANHYEGRQVQCKFCSAPFLFRRDNAAIRRIGRYLECPHCHKELRVAEKYVGCHVACKYCNGQMEIVAPPASPP